MVKLVSRFTYKYRNYLTDDDRYLFEVKEHVHSEPGLLNDFYVRIIDVKTQRYRLVKYKARNYILRKMLEYCNDYFVNGTLKFD